jgi:hypothetical protein
LQSHGIEAIPFKGPIMAVSAYGDVCLRQFSDLDILVRPHDARKAMDLLLADGYRSKTTETSQESLREHHFKLGRSRPSVILELHWRITEECYAFALDTEVLWQRKRSVSFENERVLSFSEEDLLLILCHHGAKHNWYQLSLVCDVGALLRSHPAMNWPAIFRIAEQLACRRMLAVGLILAHDLLSCSLPPHVAHWLNTDPVAVRLSSELRQQLLSAIPAPPTSEQKWQFYLQSRERLTDRIHVCLGLEQIPRGVDQVALPLRARLIVYLMLALTPNQRDRDWIRLPAVLSFAYYLIRPIRLLAKSTRLWWQSLHSSERLDR